MATDDKPLNLSKLAKYFNDEMAARELLESVRWPNGAECPLCARTETVYRMRPRPDSKKPGRPGLLRCRTCKRQFTVTTGTVFEDSHIPLSKWMLAIHLLAASKKGMSAHQFHRMLGITYKSAWFMAHRLRYAMTHRNRLACFRAWSKRTRRTSPRAASAERDGGLPARTATRRRSSRS